MDSIRLILTAVLIIAFSGLPAAFFSKKSFAGQIISVILLITGSLAGIAGTILSFLAVSTPVIQLPWLIPWGQFYLSIDPLSAFFLILIFIIPALGSIYSLSYWKQPEHTGNGRRLGLFYGLLTASMAMVVISRDAVLFLISWEIMALSAYFASTAENHKPEVRTAGWIYLVATHIGTLLLTAMFLLWNQASGSFSLETAASIPSGIAGTIFILAVIGFGLKAGIMPFHIWLPGAHSNAPSHVSAVMSGVMLKMGIYGIIRMTGLLPVNADWWGPLLLLLGMITGIGGISFALSQRDIKRALAYSSIENIGIICMAIGLALLGRSLGSTELMILGLSGALLHVLNHGLFKPLLFFNAGIIIHETGTKDIEKLGGLMKRIPRTGFLFVIGAAAICALPPLNGFVSEWLIYIGFFHALETAGKNTVIWTGLGAASLAMIGSLAIAALVKLLSTVFLGSPRTEAGVHAHEPPFSMQLPMIVAAVFCLTIGLYPVIILPVLEKAVGTWASIPADIVSLKSLVPFEWISIIGISILGGALLLTAVIKIKTWKKPAAKSLTWDCGYAEPAPRMQYTGSSFVQGLVQLFTFFLWPKSQPVKIETRFPAREKFSSQVPDSLLDRIILPVFNGLNRYLPWVRVFQQGQTQIYVLYILVIVIILFIF